MSGAALAFAETRGRLNQTPGARQLDKEQDQVIRAGARLVAPELDTIQATITANVARARSTDEARAWLRRQTTAQPAAIGGDDLGDALYSTILSGLVVGRYHALRDVFEPTLVFAERVPRLPASWGDARVTRRALDYLEGKKLLTPRDFARLTDSAKHSAFKIAGVTRKTALDLARQEVLRGIRRGETPEAVAFRLNRRFEAAGYQPLRPWHAELVAEQNFLNAYGAASWSALKDPRVAGLIPYFRYLTMADERVRPAHRALHGLFLKRDNPAWLTIWPPNGFRCRCKVIGVTVNTVRTYGIVEDRVPKWTEDDNGKRVRVIPDKGFRSNPGAYLRNAARAGKAATA